MSDNKAAAGGPASDFFSGANEVIESLNGVQRSLYNENEKWVSTELNTERASKLLDTRDKTYLDIRRDMSYRLINDTSQSQEFKLTDFKYHQTLNKNVTLNLDELIIRLFQPQLRVFWSGLIANAVFQLVLAIPAVGEAAKVAVKALSAAAAPVFVVRFALMQNNFSSANTDTNSQTLSLLSDLVNPSKSLLNTLTKMLFGSPILQYAGFFSDGKWLNVYHIPYFTSEEFQYLPDMQNRNSWTFTSATNKLFGDTIGLLLTSTGMNVPSAPMFSSEKIFLSKTYPLVSTNFYLINETEDDLIKNFKFLNSIFAGTQWFQLSFGQIKSPNVYNVLCPGRFHLIWASMDVSVTRNWQII